MNEHTYIRFFNTLSLQDGALVGGKNSSLGQLIRDAGPLAIKVPNGFAVTALAYWYFIEKNGLVDAIKNCIRPILHDTAIEVVHDASIAVRALIMQASIPNDLADAIVHAYHRLSLEYGSNAVDVAVRSSATAEDLPGASFAGQQETYLNVSGDDQVLSAYKKCLSSLFTERAILYRIDKGFDHFSVGLSVGIQKMVRSDLASAGVAFSLDTESGFKNIVSIDAAYGLGQLVVQGEVIPDHYTVFKPMITTAYDPILEKRIGSKKNKLIYAKLDNSSTTLVSVPEKQTNDACLSDQEIIKLARMVKALEEHYSALADRWTPVDVEWAKDGIDHEIYIVQVRPETVHALHNMALFTQYTLKNTSAPVLVEGVSIGQQIVAGSVCRVHSLAEAKNYKPGSILVTTMTDPDWLPLMRQSAGIITDLGGRTCHAAIVARELGIPALVGTHNAMQVLADGQEITMDCSKGSVGVVYAGKVPYTTTSIDINTLKKPSVPLLVNIAEPARAFSVAQLPHVQGVGLARLEFIIAAHIKAHPMAFINPDKIIDLGVRAQVEALFAHYQRPQDFFIDTLAQGIATIAAAFWPRFVLVRFSDFKSNEYASLLGGSYFEPQEENPMLGLRGASRYYSPLYEPAFVLEIAAIKKVREEKGLTNVAVMLPFVRTMDEARHVIALLKEHGLQSGDNGLKLFMMVEIPSNVILLDQFCELFDGFSIGSNDLTQCALAVDRDSAILAPLFDERDPAVKKLMSMAIATAHAYKKYIGICGQAPSDYPEVGDFVIECGIDSLSLNPDAIIPFLSKRLSEN